MKWLIAAISLLALSASSAQAAQPAACAAHPITSGYGADGPYTLETKTLANPGDASDQMTLYLPQGAPGPRPVIFFGHGFGPGRTETYADIIRHMVSKGYIVVFSTYPMRGVTIDQRYDSLWRGFEAAAATFSAQMDLSRVAFVGHSFGASAVPAMAYKGLVEKGWGKNGAFLMELAPWYSYQITNAKIAALPAKAVQFIEVYDNDEVNDHRMAIDLYNASHATDRFYFLVQSNADCDFTANHATPGRSPSTLQKQYAVSRPFDALTDWVFHGDAAARTALRKMGDPGPGYQPLRRPDPPTPSHPESFYRSPWTNPKNPRS
ncbi:MAG TPA: alpha/beta hydrolase [Phenylobacterium sp.]|jgi:acetyl esterase/lipase|nr:alpha/beta hydrolase [Phenylobacterium sp.]